MDRVVQNKEMSMALWSAAELRVLLPPPSPELCCKRQAALRGLELTILQKRSACNQNTQPRMQSVDYGFCYAVNRSFTLCHPLAL